MAIFAAIGQLINMVKNMTKRRNDRRNGDSEDSTFSVPKGDGNGSSSSSPQQQNKNNCAKGSSSSSRVAVQKKPDNQGDSGEGDEDGDIGIGIDMANVLPSMNLNVQEEDNSEENEPGKSFLELLFAFILDPLTAIIKGIVQTVKLVIVTINVATNLKKCAKWFIIYVFCTLVYLPISILFSLLNLSNLEKKIWKILNSIDSAVFCLTEKLRGPGKGFHLVKFNDDIREICFLEDVVPTNCAAPNQNKPKSGKTRSLSDILGRYLFLIVTIFFMCFFIYYKGRNGTKIEADGKILTYTNSIPFTFLLLLFMVVCVTLFLIVSVFTSAFIYIFIVSVFPLTLLLFSFMFYMFTLFYDDKEVVVDKFHLFKPKTWKPTFEILASYYIGMIGLFLQLPVIYQYIVGCISIFVIFFILLIIIFLSIPVEYTTVLPIAPFNLFFSFLNVSELFKKVGYKINYAMGRIPSSSSLTK